MKKIILKSLVIALVTLGFSSHAQTLLYQWAFTNSTDTVSNSAPSFAITPGTGSLTLSNITGNIFTAGAGADGVNPLFYFTNANTGPGSGPGVNAMGALVANGQGYNSGNSAVAIVTNLNLGNLNQMSITFWVKLGPGVSGQFPRLVQFGQTPAFDIGNKGSGAHNDFGASINLANGFIQEQNTVANTSQVQATAQTVTGLSNFPAGLPIDNTTWIFEAITYDGTLAANQFVTWLGTPDLSVQSISLPANFGLVNFTTNATVIIGGDAVAGTARGLSTGAIADVRFYSGVLTSNMADNIRTFKQPGVIPPGNTPVTIVSQPVSGNTFVNGTRTFSVFTAGIPNNFSYLWRSNGVPVAGATNASLTVSNVQLTANGASFVCSVTNFLVATGTAFTGTNTLPAILTVLTPATGSYAQAVVTNNPFSFWLLNEPTNGTAFPIFDYVNGHDGLGLDPTNMFFVGGPSYPTDPGFPANNTAIETRGDGRGSRLNMANPGNFPNTGMTICGWVNTPAPVAANGLMLDLVSDTAGAFGLVFNGPNMPGYQWGTAAPTSGFSTGITFNTNEWTFVALVVGTNLTQADTDNLITADTNATIYVGAPSIGLQSATDSTALNGDVIGSGTSAGTFALGRTASAASDNGSFFAQNTVGFNGVAIFYSALSPQTITNLYITGAGISLTGGKDPNTPGSLLLNFPMGTLQSSTNLTGPYTDVQNAFSPYSTPIDSTAPQMYFRVRK